MSNRFQFAASGPVNILELALPEDVQSEEFDRLNETLTDAIAGRQGGAWVLDLAGVAYTGSAVLGLMVNIRQTIKQGGGNLVMCGLSERLAQVVRTCSLDRLFKIAATREQAVRAVS